MVAKTSGNGHKHALHFEKPPTRVVSLVPSITESLCDLGLERALVGITEYCIHPAEKLAALPRLGGPKDPDLRLLFALKPDLVLANQEENTPQTIAALESHGVPVWVTFPKTVRQALDVLWLIVGVFSSPTAAVRLETLEKAVAWAEAALVSRQPRRYFCPIWLGKLKGEAGAETPWWMTFNQDTYVNDLLRLVGGENVFAQRQRRYPLKADLGMGDARRAGKRDTRYPRVTLQEIRQSDSEVILLPDEPYLFAESHLQELCELLPDSPAVTNQRLHLVSGSLLTWHGTRLALALQELPGLFL